VRGASFGLMVDLFDG